MAKQRYINTKMWRDNYFENLDPIEKLLFIYFLTNPDTNISGIYEIQLKIIASDTGIDKEMLLKILKRFHKDQKVYYKNGENEYNIINTICMGNQKSALNRLCIDYEKLYNKLGVKMIKKEEYQDPYADCKYIYFLGEKTN